MGRFVEEFVVGVEDVTEMAGRLKGEIERRREAGEKIVVEELIELGCLPREEVYDGVLDEEVKRILEMDGVGEV